MERQSRSWIMPVVFLTLLLCIGGGLISRFTQRNDYSLEELNQAMEKNQVTEVYIRPNREVPTGKILVRLKTGEEKEFTALDVKEIQEMVEKSGEDISVKVGDVYRNWTSCCHRFSKKDNLLPTSTHLMLMRSPVPEEPYILTL